MENTDLRADMQFIQIKKSIQYLGSDDMTTWKQI